MNVRKMTYNGVKISQYDIDTWHEEALNFISSGKGDYFTKASGNSIVIANKRIYEHDPDNPVIQIYIITNGYTEYKYSELEVPF